MSTASHKLVMQARGLVKRYGQVTALDGADFELRAGEILAVIGDNGAGKSSLIKALSGATIPDAGEILLDGKPIHLSARVHSQAGARDPFFGVGTDGAVIYRHVEMFQWIEYSETTGRGSKKRTRYYYEQGWDSEYHDSSQFHEPQGHENPKPALESDGFFAADARFGPYRFNNRDVADQALDDMYDPDALGSLGKWPALVEDLPELSSALTAKRWYQLEPGVYYRGNQASEEAQLGDLSVSFYRFANDYPLTLIARQDGEQLSEWRASNGDELLLAAGGTLDARTVVKIAGDDIPVFFRRKLSPHQIALPDVLASLELLGTMPREIVVLGVEPVSLELGMEMTPTVAEKIPKLVDMALTELAARGYLLSPQPAAAH